MIRVSARLPNQKLSRATSLQSVSAVLNGVGKRAFDLIVAFIGLIAVAPAFVLLAMLIKRDSPGPVFFRGSRAGRNGRPFQILKFRTMYETRESYHGPSITAKGDRRITPLGHWLRDSKINELPQLWNVLIGDMSLVGPRPEDVAIAQTWPEEARNEILSVRPGITSPASILYRDEESLLSGANLMGDYFESILPDKMRLDRLYVRNHSLLIDLDTIFWTLAVLIPRMIKAPIPEGYLFAGPVSRLVSRHLSWLLVDLATSLVAASGIVLLWRSLDGLEWGLKHFVILATLLASLFGTVNAMLGLNRIVWSEAYAEDGAWLILSAGLATMMVSVLNYLQRLFHFLPLQPLPTAVIVTIGLTASIGFAMTRYRFRLLTGLATRWLRWRGGATKVAERVLIVGSGEGYRIANWLVKQGEKGSLLAIVGVIDDEHPTLHGMRVKGNPVLGGLRDLPEMIRKYDVGVVLSAAPHQAEQIAEICKANNARLVHVSDLLDVLREHLAQPAEQQAVDMPVGQ